MDNSITDQILIDSSFVSKVDLKEIKILYPKIQELIIPLSHTKISARTFFNWKKEGLIDLPEFEKNDWVRLNVFQYVWLKIIEELRYFGVSLSSIRTMKKFLFSNIVDPVMENSDILIQALKKNTSMSKEQIEFSMKIIKDLKERGGIPAELKIIETQLGAEIISTLVRGTHSSLIVLKKENEMYVNFTSFNSKSDIDDLLPIYPNIQIPLKKIIEGLFEEPKNSGVIETLGLISPQEKQVLDALRDHTFKEITIKKNNEKKTGKNSVSIEVLKETDVINEQKIKEIKRMLGLNEYSEITLKYRNAKHIFLKNKVRLTPDPTGSAQK